MSTKCIIFCFKDEAEANNEIRKQYQTKQEVEAKVWNILNRVNVSKGILCQLPYKQYRVPRELKRDQTYYLYFMNHSKGGSRVKLQKKLKSPYLSIMPHREVFNSEKNGEQDEDKFDTMIEKENKCLKSRLGEVQAEQVENLAIQKKLKMENLTLNKQREIFQSVSDFFAEDYAHCPLTPFRFEKGKIARRCESCQKTIKSNSKNCCCCKGTLTNDWSLTLMANASYSAQQVRHHGQNLAILQEIIDKKEVEEVKISTKNTIVYKKKGQIEEIEKLKDVQFSQDLYPLNSAFVNSLLGLKEATIEKYLENKQKQIPEASQWMQRKDRKQGFPVKDRLSLEEIRQQGYQNGYLFQIPT